MHSGGFPSMLTKNLPNKSSALDDYLKLRPNLKTKEDYKKIFVPNSSLADVLIEGLVKAGWEPED